MQMINQNSKAARYAIYFLKTVAIAIALLTITAVIAIKWDRIAVGKVVRGKYFKGLIVKDDGKPPVGWTPTKEQVLSLEDGLRDYVLNHPDYKNSWIATHLSEYKIQYWGYIHDRSKILQINFHHNSSVKYGLWKIPFGVLGGGCYHFTVIYDIEKKKFTKLSVNADA